MKIHATKRRNFLDHALSETADLHAYQCVTATKRYSLAHSISHGFFFVLLGILLFILPRYGILGEEALSGYVLACLFLMGPVSGIVYSIPAMVRARIASERIATLGVDLHTRSSETASSSRQHALRPHWNNLRLENASFTYFGVGSPEFTVGPIQLEIPRGELRFITGANGSGKTTLGKMLAGLYEPVAGLFTMDEQAITNANRDAYRQHVSAVFSDDHLFGNLSGNHTLL